MKNSEALALAMVEAMMKKDYKFLADIIKDMPFDGAHKAQIAVTFARKLKEDNDKFNQTAFFNACLTDDEWRTAAQLLMP